MNISYNTQRDLLYIRMDEKKQELINRKVNSDVILDIGKHGKIIGIEILDASKNLNLENLLPVKFKTAA